MRMTRRSMPSYLASGMCLSDGPLYPTRRAGRFFPPATHCSACGTRTAVRRTTHPAGKNAPVRQVNIYAPWYSAACLRQTGVLRARRQGPAPAPRFMLPGIVGFQNKSGFQRASPLAGSQGRSPSLGMRTHKWLWRRKGAGPFHPRFSKKRNWRSEHDRKAEPCSPCGAGP